MGKHKQKNKQRSKQLSDKKWRKLLRAKNSTILRLSGSQEFCLDGSIRITTTSYAPFGKATYSAHEVSIWDMLGFKHEVTPGTSSSPGPYRHTFTDNTSLGYWLSQSGEEKEEQNKDDEDE